LQSSGISSLATTSASQSPAGPTRKRFALKGRSAPIDSRVDAVRRDLADVRLADRVFAPHYAAPMPRVLAVAAELRSGSAVDTDVLAELAVGDIFEVLEFAGDHAWGVARGLGLVGYLPAATLADAQ
jgi:hypothetical protein